MKSTKRLKLILLIFFVLTIVPTKGGNQNIVEKVILITDRNFYVCGEDILFSATILINGTKSQDDFSKVLYLEIITPDGESISGAKHLIKNGYSNGSITIPTNIPSGNYYLRAYTKWMRNYNNYYYSYGLLKIVNPFKNELLNLNTDNVNYIETKIDSLNNRSIIAKASIEKQTFNVRENVSINLEYLNNDYNKKIINTIVTVIPENTAYNTILEPKDNNSKVIEDYLPEINGVSISGKVISSNDNKPLSHTRINLSIIGESDISTQISDTLGHFYFGFFNLNGQKDVFLCAEQQNGITPRILIDNDFCNRKIQLQNFPFVLSVNEKQTATDLIQNLQVDSLFNIKKPFKENIPQSTSSFYGKPNKAIYLDNYIQLPSIEEYFTEFIGDVVIKKKNGRRNFKIMASNSSMQLYDPLVMIDFVAIEDHEQILKLNPQNISKIEIVNKLYVKGNQTYGGIISFLSKKNNFAGIELPSSGIFFNYDFLNSTTQPRYINNTNTPDTRNTLHWNQFFEQKPNNFSFTTGDTPGNFQVVIRCIDTQGIVYTHMLRINVANTSKL